MLADKKNIGSQLVKRFQTRETFSRDELFRFFKEHEPHLKEGTFGWRIYNLRKKGIIRNVRKGMYTLDPKQIFRPEADAFISQLGSFLEASHNSHFYNVWTTAWLNELIELQVTSFLYILEVDNESIQSVFFSLKDAGIHSSIFLKPDEKVIENYISELAEAIIIESMITRAPVVKVKNIFFPTLEKILVGLVL